MEVIVLVAAGIVIVDAGVAVYTMAKDGQAVDAIVDGGVYVAQVSKNSWDSVKSVSVGVADKTVDYTQSIVSTIGGWW